MVTLTFPDGATRDFDAGVTAMEVAKSISKGLAKQVLAAKLDGTLVDAALPINDNANRASGYGSQRSNRPVSRHG